MITRGNALIMCRSEYIVQGREHFDSQMTKQLASENCVQIPIHFLASLVIQSTCSIPGGGTRIP